MVGIYDKFGVRVDCGSLCLISFFVFGDEVTLFLRFGFLLVW